MYLVTSARRTDTFRPFDRTSYGNFLSKLRSATSYFNLRFFSSKILRRLISLMIMAPYFVFHRKKVIWQMPSFRQTSSTCNPDSACPKAYLICSCAKLFLSMVLNLYGKTKSYKGSHFSNPTFWDNTNWAPDTSSSYKHKNFVKTGSPPSFATIAQH